MKYWELFTYLKSKEVYRSSGNRVDWDISIDNELKIIRLEFQQSHGCLDWFYNFLFFPVTYKTIYKDQKHGCLTAHSGFVKAYKSTNDTIMNTILDILNLHPDYEVVIVGWSHGGALTQLAAEDLNFRTRTDINNIDSGVKPNIITYGAPKVFVSEDCVEYVRSCCNHIVQIAQNNDIVSYVPPFDKFKHLQKDFARCGVPKNPLKFINPWIYHTSYDDKSLYEGYTYPSLEI